MTYVNTFKYIFLGVNVQGVKERLDAPFDPGQMPVVGWNGERLTEIREYRGVKSQTELADLAGVSQPNVNRWEDGREPSYNNAIKLADALNVTIDAFRQDVGDPIIDAFPQRQKKRPKKSSE